MNGFACGVTIYNPSIDVFNRLLDYCNSFEYVYVFDNTEKDNKNAEYINLITGLTNNQKIIYLTENSNKGLPYAFNRILEDVYNRKNIQFLCTLDQDSIFDFQNIHSMIRCCNDISNEYAVIAPYVIYNNSIFNKSDSISSCRYVIASGSFLNIKVLKDTGIFYDENYFIDKFEVDFERQLINKGYKIGQYNGAVLYQELGTSSGHKHPNHSVLRHYYIFRNRLYYNKKFKSRIVAFILDIFQTLKHICLVLLFEDNKICKIKQFSIALSDYRNNKMGFKGSE